MNLLPEIVDGELILSKEEKRQTGYLGNNGISPARRKLFEENLNKIKAKKLEEDLKKADEVMAELNNDGRPEVAEDFSDSPHADRQPLTPETE